MYLNHFCISEILYQMLKVSQGFLITNQSFVDFYETLE